MGGKHGFLEILTEGVERFDRPLQRVVICVLGDICAHLGKKGLELSNARLGG